MLKETFLRLMRKYTKQEDYILDCWDEICKNYSSRSRHYHNLIHIYTMLTELKNVKPEVKELDSLLFSIFYHDIVYDISNFDNEYQSALLFKNRIGKTEFRSIKKCIEQIESTKEHKLSIDHDTNILLDLDLVVLGKSNIEYQEYCEQIRKEYEMYSDSEYRDGRKKVLGRFLESSSIFKTDYFKTKYEENARMNLTQELKSLDK